MSKRSAFVALALFAAWSAAGLPILAQADPSARVGRLTGIEGAISFRPAADTEWGVGEPNRPVTTGDRVWSDPSGRAEIQMGDGTVRLWHATEVDIVRLSDHTMQIAVPQGSATLRISGFSTGDVAEIDAPNAAITADATGEYRVDVSPDGLTTTVKVWSGSAEVTSAGSSFALDAHQEATIHGDSTAAPTYDVAEIAATDDFDQWSTGLDERANRTMTERRYVSGDMPGAEDLDDNGSWDYDNDNGPVWYPTHVEADWAPYRAGHWVWVDPWGWTWVDDAPWGWAPFHYGRWARFNDRWGWCPGRVIAPVVFAPALVVFIGGPSWAVTANFGAGGGIGWFPLGPGEVYRPSYAVSTQYVRRVNITTVTNITNITNITNVTTVNYRNRSVAGAVTAVPRNVFENAAPVGRAVVRVPDNEVLRAPVIGAGPAVVPTRASVVFHTQQSVAVPRPVVQARTVVALHAPPPAPAQLAEQFRAVAANGGRPATPQQLAAVHVTSTPAATDQAVRMLPVRSAARPAPTAAQLTPARPGLPATRPAVEIGTVAHPIAVPPASRVTPPLPTEPTPQAARPVEPTPPPPVAAGVRVGVAPSRAPVAGPPPPVPRPPLRTASPTLDASYAAQRQAQEARHVQEFAKPAPSEPTPALAARHQTEDQALASQYHQAAAANHVTMPPPAPPSRPAVRSAPSNAHATPAKKK